MKYNVKIIKTNSEILYEERETGITHTPFNLELNIFNSIKAGDSNSLSTALDEYFSYGFIIGDMSNNQIKEIKYWAISTISLAIHYSILGGLDETDAYNLSDKYIRKIDTFNDISSCIDYLKEKAFELTALVHNSKHYSSTIRNCIHYIHIHLHEQITVDELAKLSNVSKDILFRLFKKETGLTVHKYIMNEKLEEAKKMITQGLSFKDITYTLSFCSQTHFIQSFKKAYGITPLQFSKNNCLYL